MSSVSKGVVGLFIVPGLGSVSYVLYEAFKSYPEYVQNIYKAQNTYGGCKFWLVKSKNEGTGGYPEEAIGSEIDKEDSTSKKHKLKKVSENIEKEQSKQMQTTCKSKPGQVVELAGNDSSGGALETGGDKDHKRPTS